MNFISKKDLQKLIYNSNTFAIYTHKKPDADAISSSLAMYYYLINIGKSKSDIDIIIPKFNQDYSFIPGTDLLIHKPTKQRYDLIIILDCATTEKLETTKCLELSTKILRIDHHESTTSYANINYINESASSCTSILYDLFDCRTKEFNYCIATGIISDTSNLSINVTKDCIYILENLKNFDINIQEITSELFKSNERINTLTEIAESHGKYLTESIYCTYILQSDLIEIEKDLDLLNHKAIIQLLQKRINFTTLIFILENPKHQFKGSLRTINPTIDLNEICINLIQQNKIIRGGGHSYSAGFLANSDPDSIFKFFKDEILKFTN